MLTEEEKKEIDAEIVKYGHKNAAILEALRIVQRRQGWVSDEGLKDVAQYLDLTEDELDSVATCYSLIFRKPMGRHVILLCDGVSCWVMGYEGVLNYLKSKLGITFGQTTADGRFTLLPSACLGACDKAPVMMIDETLHGNLDKEKIDKALEQYQ